MRRIILSSVAIVALSTSAFAWDNTTNGNHNQIVDGGPGAQANANARQHQTQAQQQGQAQHQTATGGSARATGGTSYGSSADSNITVNSSLNGGSSGGGGGRAPDVILPSIGGGGMDCPTVGFGAAGSGLGGGGGFGPSWISSDCNKRKIADLLSHLYGGGVARAYAEQNLEGVKEAVALANSGNHTDPAPTPAAWHPAVWCQTASVAEQRKHYADCFQQ